MTELHTQKLQSSNAELKYTSKWHKMSLFTICQKMLKNKLAAR